MKKLLILSTLTVLLFASCATSKQSRTYQKTLDGNWLLRTITTEGITGKIKVELFNEADFNCFIGSTWTFDNHRNLGTYNISKSSDCVMTARNFRWTIYEAKNEPKLFQFKRLDDKLKELDDGNGYRFNIIQLDNKSMQLRSDITFENKPAAIIYNFIKD